MCFRLKRLFLVHDFPTVVSELRFWPRVSNQGRNDEGFLIKGGINILLKGVEFMCCEMLPYLRRRLQMVLMWPNEWCTMEIWYVWVMVCDMCMEKVLYGLQICVVVSSRLRCLIMLDLHGECGARNVQWWCFAWLTRCFVNNVASLCCGRVVAWPRWRYDGFPLSISELLVTMM